MSSVIEQRSRIFLSPPHVGEKEKSLLVDAFESNWIAPMGPFVEKFENKLSLGLSGRPVVALSSGTAAIHLALLRLGVAPGDIVLAQSFSFCATANPIKYLGADVAFVGSEADTWNICPKSLESAILSLISEGRKPKAFIPVHLYGVPAKLDELVLISEKYQIPMVEDAAESLGSEFDNRPTGSFGAYGVLSFNGNKIITTSGGGALICPDQSEYEAVKHLATQAREPAPYYLHEKIGYNYRLSNLCAAIGVGQIDSLKSKISRRREIYERYRNQLNDILDFVPEAPRCIANRWLSVALLKQKVLSKVTPLKLIAQLETQNVECRPLWKPLHTQPVFKGARYFGNHLESELFEKGICLPSGSGLKPEEQDFVIKAIRIAIGVCH